MTYEEPMPWMGERCPYGVAGCACHMTGHHLSDVDPYIQIALANEEKRMADAYERWLQQLDSNDAPVYKIVDAVDRKATPHLWWLDHMDITVEPDRPWWRRLIDWITDRRSER